MLHQRGARVRLEMRGRRRNRTQRRNVVDLDLRAEAKAWQQSAFATTVRALATARRGHAERGRASRTEKVSRTCVLGRGAQATGGWAASIFEDTVNIALPTFLPTVKRGQHQHDNYTQRIVR